MKPNNPFLVRGYAGPEFFCDRAAETESLVSSIENDRDVTLIAPRRYGKTGLVHNVFHRLRKKMPTIYVDIFQTRSLADFTRSFSSAVTGALDTKFESAVAAAARFFKSCRPTVTAGPDGSPSISFDVVPARAEETLAETFAYLARRDRRAVVAIDEFQQVLEYPEQGTEALLRSQIQFVPGVRFVFAGSRQHLMREMFLSPKHPFYQSTDILSLGPIDRAAYLAFARRHFRAASLELSQEAFSALYDRFGGVTWYLQMVLNRLWARRRDVDSPAAVEDAVSELVETRALEYNDLLRSQPPSSQAVLRALAAEGTVAEPTSGNFVARCGLGAASTAASALDALRRLDLVYETPAGWIVYDRFFGEWLARFAPPSPTPRKRAAPRSRSGHHRKESP